MNLLKLCIARWLQLLATEALLTCELAEAVRCLVASTPGDSADGSGMLTGGGTLDDSDSGGGTGSGSPDARDASANNSTAKLQVTLCSMLGVFSTLVSTKTYIV